MQTKYGSKYEVLSNLEFFPYSQLMQSTSSTFKNALVYLAYGSEYYKYQVIVSIYTFLHHLGSTPNTTLFVIYTDKNTQVLDKHLEGLPVKLEVLTKQQVQEFIGSDSYIFRLKSSVIKDFFRKYPQNIFYLDTDTYFLRDATSLLQQIAPGSSLMNVEEYNFEDGGPGEPDHWFILRKCLRRNMFTVKGQSQYIPITSMMWNAGVIGLSQADAGLINEVIALNDEMYSRCKTFIVEQFVTSYILHISTQLRSTEDYIEHYWRKEIKASFNLLAPKFLQENANLAGPELYAKAFEFAQKTNQIATSFQEPLAARIKLRMKLILQVARKGHL